MSRGNQVHYLKHLSAKRTLRTQVRPASYPELCLENLTIYKEAIYEIRINSCVIFAGFM